MPISPAITTTTHNNKYLEWWEKHFLPVGIPLLAGLILGPLLAVLIVNEVWYLVYVIPFLIPVGILLFKYPFAAFMIWLVVLPFFPPTHETRVLYWIFHRALIPGVWGVIVISRMLKIKKYPRLQLEWADLAILIYLIVGLISILFTLSDPLKAIYDFYDKPFVPFMAYLFVRTIKPDSKQLKRLMPFILILILAQGIIGLISWFSPEALPAMWLQRNQVGSRITGSFSEAVVYTTTMIWLLLFLFHYAMTCGQTAKRTFFLVVFSFGLICVFLSFSRASWLGAILVLSGLLYLYPRTITLLLMLALPTIVILSAITGILANEIAFAQERVTGEAGQRSAQDRLIHIEAGKGMFLAKPIFGWGYGTYDQHDWKFMKRVGNIAPSKWDIQRGTSHHSYVTILAETGAIGLIAYLFPIFWWLVRSIKIWPQLPKQGFWSRQLLISLWLYVLFYVVVTQTIDIRFFLYSITLFWFTLGLIANIVQEPTVRRDQVNPGLIGDNRWLEL